MISTNTHEHKAFIMWPVAGVENIFILHKLPRVFRLHLNKAKCQRSPYSEHRAAASGLLGSKVTGRTSRSDTAGALRPSELRVKCVPAVFVFVFSLPAVFQAGRQKAGRGKESSASEVM